MSGDDSIETNDFRYNHDNALVPMPHTAACDAMCARSRRRRRRGAAAVCELAVEQQAQDRRREERHRLGDVRVLEVLGAANVAAALVRAAAAVELLVHVPLARAVVEREVLALLDVARRDERDFGRVLRHHEARIRLAAVVHVFEAAGELEVLLLTDLDREPRRARVLQS